MTFFSVSQKNALAEEVPNLRAHLLDTVTIRLVQITNVDKIKVDCY